MCTCFYLRGKEGDECNEKNAFAQGMGAIDTLVAIIAFIASLFCMFLIYKSFNRTKIGSALQTTLVFSTLACIGLGMELAFEATSFLSSDRDLIVRLKPLDMLGVVLGFIFASCSMLNVSLLWIDVANTTQRMKAKPIINVQGRNLVIAYLIYYNTIGIAMPLLVGYEMFDYALIVVIPAFVFIIITYSLGERKMNTVLQKSGSKDEQYKAFQRNVTITARSIVFSTTALIVLCAVLASAPYPTPSPQANNYFNLVFMWIMLMGLVGVLSVIRYCAFFIKFGSFSQPASRMPNNSKEHSLNSKRNNAQVATEMNGGGTLIGALHDDTQNTAV